MIIKTNSSSGGVNLDIMLLGESLINSFIRVIYPEGATCSCSNGTTTVVAPNTCGAIAFAIPTAGDWTITITQTGYITQSKTQTVVADTIYDIKLIFDLVLYDTGDENIPVTGGWVAGGQTWYGHVTSTNPTVDKESSYMHIYGNPNGNVTTTNYIDLTDYDYITIDYEMIKANDNQSYNTICIFSETDGFYRSQNNAAIVTREVHQDLTLGRHTTKINVSQLVGGYRISYFLYSGNTDFRVYSIIASQNREQITIGTGYQRIEYITSATKTVIDTGVYMQADMSVIANIMMGRSGSSVDYDFHVLGRYNDDKYSYFAGIYRDRYTYSGLNGGGYSPSMSGTKGPRQITLNKKYEFTCVLKDGIYKSYIDGDLHQYRTGPVTIASGTNSLLIFAYGYNASTDQVWANSSQNRIYSMKVYYRDNLIRNFVPCYRISDSKIGLWDMVSQQFFSNPLSGTFIGGPNV